jgi:hypothetical protein
MTPEFFTVGELLDRLAEIPRDRGIMCQVAATNGQAWYLMGSFAPDVSGYAVLSLRHPYLVNLPSTAFYEPQAEGAPIVGDEHG